MRQIRMLRAMRRELETGLRRLLHGHAGGNPGHSQGVAYELPRQFPTLPPVVAGLTRHPTTQRLSQRVLAMDWLTRLVESVGLPPATPEIRRGVPARV